MTFDIPRHTISAKAPNTEDSKVAHNFEPMKANDLHHAVSVMCHLAQFDSRLAKRPFFDVFNEINAGALYDQYTVFMMPYEDHDGKIKRTPVGYIIWGQLTSFASAYYGKGIRPLAPAEFAGGKEKWIVQFVAPFAMQAELGEWCADNLTLFNGNDTIFAIDIFESFGYNEGRRELSPDKG